MEATQIIIYAKFTIHIRHYSPGWFLDYRLSRVLGLIIYTGHTHDFGWVRMYFLCTTILHVRVGYTPKKTPKEWLTSREKTKVEFKLFLPLTGLGATHVG